ncbi:MAG TPA: chromosome segregation protein SMC, partial [Capsulimonadaceae bacterium]|nr:chromosome segregation protein SMC [Capsulimonadaceae bacterium]
RGTKTQDVIFAGSANRKPLGMAEVSLTVDNSDRTLPLGFDEVTITRRAYRSGEGEYFLNKTPCRLKDIYELFLDTGVGREAYALVNQSEIDAVLSADPQARRGLFEEAAGIKKYRVKKREALKKLEATEANLTRVRDIMVEIEEQLVPLESQAEIAARYLSLKERLGQIERDHLIAELRLADYEMCAAKQAREEEEAALAAHCRRLSAAEERSADISRAVADAEAKREACRERHQAALSAAEQARSRRELALQRREGISAQIALLGQEIEDLQERLTRAHSLSEEEMKDLATVRAEEARCGGELSAREGEIEKLSARVAGLNREEEERRVRSLQRAREQALRQAEVARAEARMAEAEATLPVVRGEAEQAQSALRDLQKAFTTVQSRHEQLEQARDAAQASLQKARTERERTLAGAQEARRHRDGVHAETLSLAARLRSLQDLEDAQEGYYSGVRAVLQAARRKEIVGEHIVVADAFSVPPGYELAMETALGSSLQDIITDTEESAKDAIEYLKQTKAGRATFLPLNRMRPPRAELRPGTAKNLKGYLGPALAILDFDDKYHPALEVLLGRVVVCETLDDALKVASVADGWGRIVTLSGELLFPTGAMTGGAQSRKGAPILERKTEIAALSTRLAASEGKEKRMEQALAAAERANEDAAERHASAEREASEANLAVSASRQEREGIEREIFQRQQRLGSQKERLQTAELALVQLREQAATAAAALAQEAATADETAPAAAQTEELRRLAAEREEAGREAMQARIMLASLAERAAGLARFQRAIEREREEIESGLTRRRERLLGAEEELGRLAATAEESAATEQTAREASEAAQAELSRAQEGYQQLRDRSQEAAASVRLIGESRAAALDEIRKSELIEARSQMQRSQLSARLLEEYDITAEYALRLEADPDVPADTPREVARLRRELMAMGEVNTGAAEEFARLTERFGFLSAQRADLEEAKAKILSAIREIDESTREIFMETFHKVGAAFDALFTRLFNGGSTQLVLTDPDDLLETGVEIIAQPPGKKKQNLTLLSGGERALTAVALLFAFLQVRPAPFCVLDEVDAPLDGANVERFADLLRDFGRETQFLIITHNPTTMEAAPIWYGVTMQEAGISRILSLLVPAAAA